MVHRIQNGPTVWMNLSTAPCDSILLRTRLWVVAKSNKHHLVPCCQPHALCDTALHGSFFASTVVVMLFSLPVLLIFSHLRTIFNEIWMWICDSSTIYNVTTSLLTYFDEQWNECSGVHVWTRRHKRHSSRPHSLTRHSNHRQTLSSLYSASRPPYIHAFCEFFLPVTTQHAHYSSMAITGQAANITAKSIEDNSLKLTSHCYCHSVLV